MRRFALLLVVTLGIALSLHRVAATPPTSGEVRRLSLVHYRDKMKAGWIGQMAGVTWGAPTEFKFENRIIPSDKVPVWTPNTINDAFDQDDFLSTLQSS